MKAVLVYFIAPVCVPQRFRRKPTQWKFRFIKRRWASADIAIKLSSSLSLVFLVFLFLIFFLPVCSGGEDCSRSRYEYLQYSSPNEIGDTLAGVSGTLAFLWLITTVFMQGKELREQRKEISRQADEAQRANASMKSQEFENSFYGLIRAYGDLVAELDISKRGSGHKLCEGRDCFTFFYRSFNKSYRKKLAKHDEPTALFYAYKDLWNKHSNDLGHYFRLVYNILRFLDEAKGLCEARHVRIFRAHLSNSELLIIYYNCLSADGARLVRYAEKFALFDNLPTLRLLNSSHMALVPKACFGANSMLTPSKNRKLEAEALRTLKSRSGAIQ